MANNPKIRSDYADAIMDAIDEGILDARDIARAAMNFLNTEEIKEFIVANGYEDVIEVD